MLDYENEKFFAVEIAKKDRASCNKCKKKCAAGEMRIARLLNSANCSGKIKIWHHVNCIFDVFASQRSSTKKIKGPDDLEGWDTLTDSDRDILLQKIIELNRDLEIDCCDDTNKNNSQWTLAPKRFRMPPVCVKNEDSISSSSSEVICPKEAVKDHTFREFRRLIADITATSSYTEKTNLVRKMLTEGYDGKGFKGDVVLWCRLLLPGVEKRIYNMQSRHLTKLFGKIFNTNQDRMLEHLEQGDISATIKHFFDKNRIVEPASTSTLTVGEVDTFLDELSKLTREDDQINHFKMLLPRCTSNDLKIIIRLIMHDLRINASAKHILDAVHPNAHEMFQSSHDLKSVINTCLESGMARTTPTIDVMTPVSPMLAETCKTLDQAVKKFPNGMFVEVKYDGERVQIHQNNDEFVYYSRSMKHVQGHKVADLQKYIPKAFPNANTMILDAEVLLIDTKNGRPQPFGTLGVHKKNECTDSVVCAYIFDCIYYNGEVLTNKTLQQRKNVLSQIMKTVPNRIVFGEAEEVRDKEGLIDTISRILQRGLEGVVIKDVVGIYEPGKRHWMKVKKDHLFEGAMADSADLLVLGAWFGTGRKGGKMSVFLMGCYDKEKKKFCTVTRVHAGIDDKTLNKLQNELHMEKICGDPVKLPNWLICTNVMIPDLIAKDPKSQPVWEITGAEFTKHDIHTANGISVRFPRVTRMRYDKNWKSATTLIELEELYRKSKETTDITLLMQNNQNNELEPSTSKGRRNKRKLEKMSINNNEETEDIKKKRENDENDSFNKTKEINQNSTETLIDVTMNKSNDGNIEENPIKKTCTDIIIWRPIENYFENVKLLLHDSIRHHHKEWIRYFIAYGGTILDEKDSAKATHVLHLKSELCTPELTQKCNPRARHIIVEWIMDTVSKKFVQNYRPYTVTWNPVRKWDPFY